MEANQQLLDKELARKIKKGDLTAFDILYKRYFDKIIRYVGRKTRQEEAEDITQEVFLKAANCIGSYDESRPFSTWIYRIAHNETINHWRKNKKHEACTSYDNSDISQDCIAELASGERGADLQCVFSEDSLRIKLALEQLKPKYRHVLIARYDEGKRYYEIAVELGITIGTVATLIHRGKRQLAEIMSK